MDLQVLLPVGLRWLARPGLSPEEKVILLLRPVMGKITLCEWRRQTGIARDTIRRALQRPPADDPPKRGERLVSIPLAVLLERTLGPQARLLFGLLQGVAGFFEDTGRVQPGKLGPSVGLCQSTARLGLRALSAAGWVTVSQKHRRAPIQFQLRFPRRPLAAEYQRITNRLQVGKYTGETLMREWLNRIVDASLEYQDGVRPSFLRSPISGELLEFDRFYPPGVAFEYNGQQHEEPTPFADSKAVKDQITRDWVKKGLCHDHRIRLVVVKAEDLSLQGMLAKVGDLLPLRDLTGEERLIRLLEFRSRRYHGAAEGGGK